MPAILSRNCAGRQAAPFLDHLIFVVRRFRTCVVFVVSDLTLIAPANAFSASWIGLIISLQQRAPSLIRHCSSFPSVPKTRSESRASMYAYARAMCTHCVSSRDFARRDRLSCQSSVVARCSVGRSSRGVDTARLAAPRKKTSSLRTSRIPAWRSDRSVRSASHVETSPYRTPPTMTPSGPKIAAVTWYHLAPHTTPCTS